MKTNKLYYLITICFITTKSYSNEFAHKIATTVYEPPVVNLQDITNSSISAQLKELEQMPTDTSIGLKPMPKSESKPTKRVATALTMSIDGPKDYRQFEYDINDSRGIPVVGAPEGGDVLMQTDSGTASLGDVLGGTGGLKPMSGIEGNPYYLRDTTPQIFKDIEPVDVYLPKYDYTVKSKTTNANKLAFLIATDVQGEPVDSYVGFDRVYELGQEDFMSGFVKGLRRQTPENKLTPNIVRITHIDYHLVKTLYTLFILSFIALFLKLKNMQTYKGNQNDKKTNSRKRNR